MPTFGSLLWTTTPQLVAPADGSLVRVTTTNLVTWTTTTWATLLVAQAEVIYLTGITISGDNHGIGQIEVDVGIGSGPTVIATVGAFFGNPEWFPFPVPYRVDAGNEVSYRVAQNQFFTGIHYDCSLTYYVDPILGASISTTQPLLCYPTRASYLDVISGGSGGGPAWTVGAYKTIIASTSTAIVLAAITTSPIEIIGHQNSGQLELDVAIGAAGFETVISTYRWSSGLSNGGGGSPGGCRILKVRPILDAIPAGVRLSMRMRANNDQPGMSVGVMYYERDTVTNFAAIATTKPTRWYPTAADNTTITTDATPWADSAWSASVTTGAAAALIAAVVDLTQPTDENELSVGVGASPTTIATTRWNGDIVTNSGNFQCQIPFPIARALEASSDLSVLVRSAETGPDSIRVGVGYIEDPDLEQISDEDPRTYPAAAAGPILTSGATFVYSPWGELTAATTADILLTGVTITANNGYVFIDLGVGASGSEAVLTTVAGWPISTGDVYFPLALPIYVAEGERVAVRWAGSAAVAVSDAHLSVTYIGLGATPPPPEPLTAEDVEIRWVRRSPFVSDTDQRIFHRKLQIDFQVGVGLSTGQGSDPVVRLRTTNDGFTWSSYREASLGALGNYLARVQWWQLGAARTRAYEISGSDPVITCMLGAWLDAESGEN